MERLNIYIEKMGEPILVGAITYTSVQDAKFSYDKKYLALHDARAISINLPLQEEAFASERTKIFFEGLLPEGFIRRSMAQRMRVQEDDYLSILSVLGSECLGALLVLKDGEHAPRPSYEELGIEQIKNLAEEGTSKSIELITAAHLSLTGASGKVGLYYNGKNWFLPMGTAPSNHIVKQSHIRLKEIVTNEQLCQLTAMKLGILCPQSFIVNTGKAREDELLFATERFDRVTDSSSPVLDGQRVPYRLHQEDFAQALGISAARKYEQAGEHYLAKMMSVLRNYSARPLDDQLKLWDLVVYNYLVGNTDNHLKNHSLLYNKELKGIRLAPAYDMLSTCIYKGTSTEFGISIGGKTFREAMTREDFLNEANDALGIGTKIAMKHFDKLANDFEAALNEATRELLDKGFPQASNIREKILRSQAPSEN
ncbi:MAG: HipA domain-containing protein [Phascolarctobacterium sp.]|nr:HipA domain-containing protein [Phascolarctobacterium sp.]